MIAYKVFTQDLCSPVRGGPPIWDGKLPFTLPLVDVDTTSAECAAGWNACRTPALALKQGGLWPGGWPCRLAHVETSHPVIERNNKLRAASWDVVAWEDIRPAVVELSQPFGDLAGEMVAEQLAWYEALGRPLRDEAQVASHLREALKARNLTWQLRQSTDARDAGAAWDAWDARAARAAWAAWDAWDARAARAAGAAWAAWDAWDARAARAAGAAWAAWAARDTRDALTLYYAARRGWVNKAPTLLTTGLRDAYRHGLGIACPVAPATLGWAMTGKKNS